VVKVTNPEQIRAIAAAIDVLPIFPPGVTSCPMDTGAQMVLTFGEANGGTPLAVVTVDISGCDVVAMTVGGRTEPALGGGAQLAAAVARILGLSSSLLSGPNVTPPVTGVAVPAISPAN
jgi:hypothetical protein